MIEGERGYGEGRYGEGRLLKEEKGLEFGKFMREGGGWD